MYISPEGLIEVEKKFGVPKAVSLTYEMAGREFEMVRRSQKNGRAHDVTLFIIAGDRIVVIRKPMYPHGAYRAPSGGITPGEGVEDGALREGLEETGLEIALDDYILRARVAFTCEADVIEWTTHVFSATPVGGELQPIDTHEIVEARLATIRELSSDIRDALIGSGSTGLRYRAELSDMVIHELIQRGRLRAS
ncbi:MAG TPA: NUDIX hydrolase [Blastocatellia bacterium]|nr:NUDIX hydrolase [Blastocatellia bacterium]